MERDQPIYIVFRSFFQFILPMLSCLFLLFFAVFPLPLPYLTSTPLQVVFIGIFYWSIFAPHRLFYTFLFLLGLIQDSLFITPLGLSSLFFIVLFFFVRHHRQSFLTKPFIFHWFVFAIVMLCNVIFMWLFLSALKGVFFHPFPMVFQLIMTVAFYPIFTWVMGFLKAN